MGVNVEWLSFVVRQMSECLVLVGIVVDMVSGFFRMELLCGCVVFRVG